MIPNPEDLEAPDYDICPICGSGMPDDEPCPHCDGYGEDIKAQDEIEDRKDNGLLTKEG
jgi:hypothetical protein